MARNVHHDQWTDMSVLLLCHLPSSANAIRNLHSKSQTTLGGRLATEASLLIDN